MENADLYTYVAQQDIKFPSSYYVGDIILD